MLNQTLLSAGISVAIVLAGQPLVEYIRGKNVRNIAARELREKRITWWKDSIIKWQAEFLAYQLDAKKFGTDPNFLLLLGLASPELQARFKKVTLQGEWGEDVNEAEFLENQEEFLKLLEELMKLVVEKELEWVLN